MDLIYTNAQKIDQGVLIRYSLDLSYGAEENNFELTLGKNESLLEYGAFIYIDDTEYGGMIDGKKGSTNGDVVAYMGRTWHGILNSKIIEPDPGNDYFTVSGDANAVLSALISRLGLRELFKVKENLSGINISSYQFERYCKGYDGIRKMLASVNAKLRIRWIDRVVQISAEPIVDYSQSPVDDDVAVLTVERYEKKVNHLICLGKGELAARTVIHLYADQFGRIGTEQHYTGIHEVVDVYDNNGAETDEELTKEGTEKLEELRDNDKSDISIIENNDVIYDIGDVVGATVIAFAITAASAVTQKIINITSGVVTTAYTVGS